MAAADSARRFITRTDVEDAARSGQTLHLGPRDVITDEAAQCARDRGVRVDRGGTGPGTGATAPVARSVPGPSAAASPAGKDARALRAAVRTAVVAELGHEPAGLDAALDKVLDGQQNRQ